jgi:outer membrane protein TolC
MRNRQRRSARRAFEISQVVAALGLAALISLTRSVAAGAQETPRAPMLLGDLYTQLQRGNPKLVAARSLARAAESRIAGALRPPDPVLQLGFMNYSVPRLAPTATIGMAQLQLMQMLPLGGKLALAGRVASSQASATSARAEDVSWDVRAQAATAFYDLYASDRSLEVKRETLRILQDIERTAESMYRVGEGRQADVLRAQVEIAKMAEDTIRVQAMREAAGAKLNALLDRDASAVVGAPVLPQLPGSIPTRAWFDSIAFGERPVVRAGLDEVRAAESSERLARKEIWPDLQVGVQYAQRGGEMGTDRMGSLMFGASIPVFARDRQLKMREETAAMKQMALSDLAAMRAETRGRIGEAYANLTAARSLARLYRTTVLPQAEATAASAMNAYRVGGVDFMTLLDDRMTVNNYQQELYTLETDQGKAWAELEMLVGRQLFDPNQVSVASAAMRGEK